jgi:hypothetical protein
MQAVGRCERRNTNTYTNIYMDFDIYKKFVFSIIISKNPTRTIKCYWKANRY